MNNPPNIAFMGSDAIAVPVLRYLAGDARVKVAGVFSQPDRPKGRGKQLQSNPLAAAAKELGLPLLQPEKPGDAEVEWLRANDVQLVLVMAYGHILRRKLLAAPPLGYVNFHASLLPKYRGASPIETAVACGETETGVSLMRIVQKMDAGAVCDVEKVTIEPLDTGASVRKKLSAATVPLLERNLDALLSGTANFVEQDESQATYCRKLEKADGQLDFSKPARELAARINGLDPWPGCYCEVGGMRIKFRQAVAVGTQLPGQSPALPYDNDTPSGHARTPEAGVPTSGLSAVRPDQASEDGERPVGASLPNTSLPSADGGLSGDCALSGASLSNASVAQSGTVIAASAAGVDVMTGEGVLRIGQLQRPGGKMLPAGDFLRGFELSKGLPLLGGEIRSLLV